MYGLNISSYSHAILMFENSWKNKLCQHQLLNASKVVDRIFHPLVTIMFCHIQAIVPLAVPQLYWFLDLQVAC
jgi:hypothetical protein